MSDDVDREEVRKDRVCYLELFRDRILAPVVLAFRRGDVLDARQCEIMRVFLRHWIGMPCWNCYGESVRHLRDDVDALHTHGAIQWWLSRVESWGIYPF